MADFDPSNSKVSEETMEEWRGRTVTGNLTEDRVPGVGPGTIAKLEEKGAYDTTFKLFGAFLGCMDEGTVMSAAQKFKDLLADFETPAAWRDTVVTAVVEKVMAGFRMPMTMDESRLRCPDTTRPDPDR